MATGDPKLWGLHIGEQGDAERLFLAHGYIGMSWAALGNLREQPADWTAFKAAYKVVHPQESDNALPVNAGQIYRLANEMKIGDYVAFRPKLTHNGTTLVFLGKVAGPYLYNPFLVPEYPNLRRVDWLRSVPLMRFSEGVRLELGARLTLFQIDTHAAEFFALIAESK